MPSIAEAQRRHRDHDLRLRLLREARDKDKPVCLSMSYCTKCQHHTLFPSETAKAKAAKVTLFYHDYRERERERGRCEKYIPLEETRIKKTFFLPVLLTYTAKLNTTGNLVPFACKIRKAFAGLQPFFHFALLGVI